MTRKSISKQLGATRYDDHRMPTHARMAVMATTVLMVTAGVNAWPFRSWPLLAALFLALISSALSIGLLSARINERAIEVARLRQLAKRLITSHDSFRAAYARQLFDSVAQQLAAAQFEIAAVDARLGEQGMPYVLSRPREIVRHVTDEVRLLADTSHPGTLDQRGLPIALRKLARMISEQQGAEIEVIIDGVCETLGPTAAMALYAAAEETIKVAVHRRTVLPVLVTLKFNSGWAELTVSDDGIHSRTDVIDHSDSDDRVSLVQEMLELIGGSIQVRSDTQWGTAIVVSVPCSPRHNVE